MFEKHVYGTVKKRHLAPLEDFDPRPAKFKGTAKNSLPALLVGKGCAFLFCSTRHYAPMMTLYHLPSSSTLTSTTLSSLEQLKTTVSAFKQSLAVSDEKVREVELNTKEQRESSLWFQVRQYRITSSLFGQVLRCKEQTPPDSLVLQILQAKQFSTTATQWGVSNE